MAEKIIFSMEPDAYVDNALQMAYQISPDHYKGDGKGYETWDYIDAHGLGYALGNVVKYVTRAGKKDNDALTDLYKAQAYLTHEINRRIGERDGTVGT
jgi:hypothetical protein